VKRYIIMMLIFCVPTLIVILSACSSPANYDKEPYEISGTIIDGNTKAPIVDARVRLQSAEWVMQEKRSDKDGKYHFTHDGGCTTEQFGIKTVGIEVYMPGYIIGNQRIRCMPKIHTLDFELLPEED
jgi:hypothetical protein